MRIAKKTIKLCILGILISLISVLMINYIKDRDIKNIFLGVMTGIFTGFFVTLCTTMVTYFQKRKEYFDNMLNLVQYTLLNLDTGKLLLERLAGIIDNGNFFEDENINSLLHDVYNFSALKKPFWGDYIPLYNRSPKKLNRYQQLFLEILNEYNKLNDLQKGANRLLRFQLQLKVIKNEIEKRKLQIECCCMNTPDTELQIANINKQIEQYNLNFSSLWTSYISNFSYLLGLTQKSVEEYTKKRATLFSIIKFDTTPEQLDATVQENLYMIKAQLDEIKQNNCYL